MKTDQKKAFIFDLDGVLINNEPRWEIAKKEIFADLFGKDIYQKLGPTIGSNIPAIHQRAKQLGSTVTFEKLFDAFQHYAFSIYKTTPITDGIQELGQLLVKQNYAIAIVSASPKAWIELVTNRLTFEEKVAVVI